MGQLEFGIWDSFPAHEMANAPLASDIYKQHLKEAQMAEDLGYQFYFTIEHQNSWLSVFTLLASLLI